jgi:putative acetyltransferase
MIQELDAELSQAYTREQMHGLHPGEEADPRLRFFLLELDGDVIGCGALRDLGSDVAELKRMFVHPAHRGRGYARDLLTELEGVAAAAGIRRLRLETGTAQHAAISLYRTSGYADIPAYGEYVGSPTSVCMEKEFPRR